MRPLGRNHGGYRGETIDVRAVTAEVTTTANLYGWDCESFYEEGEVRLLALHLGPRLQSAAPRRIYLSAGIHGDEPAGPLAVLELLRENRWPGGAELFLCPCLNPAGLRRNARENAQGLDLNRQYLHPVAPETLAHVAWLDRQPDFDVTVCLHEDWEAQGFYLYELNPDRRPSLAEEIVRRAGQVCPIDLSPVIEGREAASGIIRPSADPRSRPDWPEAFYLLTKKTRLSYTLEASSDFELASRVAALVSGARAVLDAFE